MMETVFFNKLNSFKDYGLVLNNKEISAPKIKTYIVEIDGANGSLDFTDVFGDVKYENRSIKLSFTLMTEFDNFLEKFSELQNEFHGKKIKVSFSTDPYFYYVGRLSLDKLKIKNVATINITIDAEPYKYHALKTVREFIINESKDLLLKNDRMRVMPTFLASSDMQIRFGEKTYNLEANIESYFSDIELEEGNNQLTILGTGDLKVSYQEGRL